MCSTSFRTRKSKMNTEGLPAKAMKRKKTRRLKKRKHLDFERCGFAEVPTKRTKGKTAAPENTTQFLMADREKVEPFRISSPSVSPCSCCTSCSTSVRGSPLSDKDLEPLNELVGEFDELYFEKDFNDLYESIHAETLLSLSKQELIDRYLELEKKEEDLQRQVRILNGNPSTSLLSCVIRAGGFVSTPHDHDQETESSTRACGSKTEGSSETTKDLFAELEDLRKTNQRLLDENERLRSFSTKG